MRNEKYYGVFDYGDELTPGSELKIEHTVVQDYYDNQIDLVPFIGLKVKRLSLQTKPPPRSSMRSKAAIACLMKKSLPC